MAHGLIYKLKQAKIRSAFTGEAAQDFVWDQRNMDNQKYIFAKQENRVQRLRGKVDVIVSDSPLLLPYIYAPEDYPVCYYQFVHWCWKSDLNLNFLLDPYGGYDSVGRVHSEEESKKIQIQIKDLLTSLNESFTIIHDTDSGIKTMMLLIKERIKTAND